MSSRLLSALITTYNRPKQLSRILEQVFQQSYSNIEVIVSDDCSDEPVILDTEYASRTKLVTTRSRSGYAGNCLNALSHASGDYVIFMPDDDELGDSQFFAKAVEQLRHSDMVFARSETVSNGFSNLIRYPFQQEYTPEEFCEELISLNFSFLDYFTFSSCIFKTEIFRSIEPFVSIFPDVNSVDISNIIKYVLRSEKISFLDVMGFRWNKPEDNSISSGKRDDMTHQTIQSVSAAIDIYNFHKENPLCKTVCNAYIEYIFNAILADNLQQEMYEHFKALFSDIDSRIFYIYGKGWAGRALASEAEKNGFTVAGFIDDFKSHDSDTLSFEKFSTLEGEKHVVIANYKYKHIYNIYKKLSEVQDTRIYDLVTYCTGDFQRKNA